MAYEGPTTEAPPPKEIDGQQLVQLVKDIESKHLEDGYIKPQPKSSYGSYPKPLPIDFGLSRWLWEKVLSLIDWLNGERKSKNEPNPKHSAEQMATLGDLFEGYEEVDRERGTPHTMGGGRR